MTNKYAPDTDVAARYGVSRNTVWRWTRERSDFPQPVRFSPGCTRWRIADLEAWEQARAKVTA